MAPTTPEVLHGHTAAMRNLDRLLELMNEVYRRQDRSERRGGRRRVVRSMLSSCRQLGGYTHGADDSRGLSRPYRGDAVSRSIGRAHE